LPKNLKQHFNWRRTGPLCPPPGYALAQDLKRRSLTEKIKPVMSILPSYAGIMPVTEKTLIITSFLVKFCFIQN